MFRIMPAPDLSLFLNLRLPGGCIVSEIQLIPGPMIDPIGRPALAKTTIQFPQIAIVLDNAQSPDEQSVSIYHELLEGLTVALPSPPEAVIDFCETDFEREARRAFDTLGVAT